MLRIAPFMRPAALIVIVGLLLAAAPIPAPGQIIEVPCLRNTQDARVLVDGTLWDATMQKLGYVLEDGAYVPWKVLAFREEKRQDESWAEGTCRMELLPVEK